MTVEDLAQMVARAIICENPDVACLHPERPILIAETAIHRICDLIGLTPAQLARHADFADAP